ncbi:MAG: dephospho-CoA kinase [Bacteroidales bacterium]|nr:dephospho-CoA kinase [Bacteroidales bacterium]
MRSILVTGGIGSGKSAVCALLRERGIPVYDCDTRTKGLYTRRPTLVPKLEKALGASLRQADGTLDKVRLASLIFSDRQARETLEGIVYPLVLQDYRRWLSRQKAPFVIIESALILSKPLFDGIYDAAVLVEAPQEVRLQRVMRRENATREDSFRRMEAQAFPMDKVDAVITNDGTKEQLSAAVEHLFFDRNSYLCKILED